MFEAASIAIKYFAKHARGRKSILVVVSVEHKMCIEYTKTAPKVKGSETYAFRLTESAGDPTVEIAE